MDVGNSRCQMNKLRRMSVMSKPGRILIAGAGGYIGGRLLKALEAADHQIRCLARRPEFLVQKVKTTTEVIAGDLLEVSSLPPAFEAVDTAYYLV